MLSSVNLNCHVTKIVMPILAMPRYRKCLLLLSRLAFRGPFNHNPNLYYMYDLHALHFVPHTGDGRRPKPCVLNISPGGWWLWLWEMFKTRKLACCRSGCSCNGFLLQSPWMSRGSWTCWTWSSWPEKTKRMYLSLPLAVTLGVTLYDWGSITKTYVVKVFWIELKSVVVVLKNIWG